MRLACPARASVWRLVTRRSGQVSLSTFDRNGQDRLALVIPMQRTIAVVEDDASLLNAIGRLLRRHGYDVQLFSSAAEGLHALAASPADCIILDCHLGAASGIELARQLSARRIEIPVIFMSGSSDAGLQRHVMDVGCIAYLQKPFQENLLLDAINKALSPALNNGRSP